MSSAIPELTRGETLTQRAVTLIRSAIVDGTLEPGSKLTIPAIARLMNVSATPVREALMHLAEAGLVTFENSRIRIAAPTPDSLREAFEVREALEGMAARLAAERRTDADLKDLRTHAEEGMKCAAAQDADGFRHHDAMFHRAISQAAHSEQLTRYINNALDLAITLRNIKRSETFFQAGAAHIHVTVVDAIEAQDANAAEASIREHIRKVLEQLLARQQVETS